MWEAWGVLYLDQRGRYTAVVSWTFLLYVIYLTINRCKNNFAL